ncbi:MAG: phenylacetate--CoA ligase family protein [Candidatus Brocadia sp.]|nr:phenylacetate--CoA ligase family protein [Candidatus Brocadia sp.]
MWPSLQILYLYDRVNRRNLLHEYKNLLKTSQYNSNLISEYQLNYLKSMLEYAGRHVPYYRQVFKEYDLNNGISPQKIISELPILTKDIIRSSFNELLSDEYRNTKDIFIYYTGGSTGQPSRVAVDKRYLDFRWAMVYYNLTWVGYKIGDSHGFIYGSHLDAKDQCSFRQRCQHWLMNSFQVNAFYLDKEDFKKFASKCLVKKPKFLNGYASALVEFSKYVEDNNLPIRFDFVESTAEYLSSEMRQKIEGVFTCKVYDRYGCREVGNIAHECKVRNGLHIDWQSVYVEIINKGKYPWLGQEYGDLVITSLRNKGMPLIRYYVGDIGKIDYSACSCGMVSPRLYLGGTRSIDILYACDGTMISASPLSLTTRDLYPIRKIQYVQKTPNYLEVNVVTGYEDDNNVSTILFARLKKIFGERMEIQFKFLDEIEREQSGKYRLTKRLF